MKTRLLLSLFAIVALVQLAVPAYMVWRWEDVLQSGRPFYWATAPVDPYDFLRGRYVDLQFKETGGPAVGGGTFVAGQTAYALVGVDKDGKAYISGVAANRPAEGSFVESRVLYTKDTMVYLKLPFKRYYLREDLAPAAEAAYRASAGKDGVALIRIKDGYAVVAELFIQGVPLPDYLRQANPK